jgi:hypothetical protein
MQPEPKSFDLSIDSNREALMHLLTLIVKSMQDESKDSLRQELRALVGELKREEEIREGSGSALLESISKLTQIVGI